MRLGNNDKKINRLFEMGAVEITNAARPFGLTHNSTSSPFGKAIACNNSWGSIIKNAKIIPHKLKMFASTLPVKSNYISIAKAINRSTGMVNKEAARLSINIELGSLNFTACSGSCPTGSCSLSL